MSTTDNAATGVPMCAEHPTRAAVGTCERCGAFFCGACASPGGLSFCKNCEARRRYVAWEDMSLGRGQRFFDTVRSSITELPRFASELPLQGGFRAPLTFALLPNLLASVIVAAIGVLFIGAMMHAPLFATSKQGDAVSLIGAVAVFVTYFATALGSVLAYLTVWAGVLTGSARVFGAEGLRYESMFRILCYASGLNGLYVVPVIGTLVLVYHVVVTVFVISAQGRVSALTALAIIGVPAVLLGTCCCGSYLLFFFTMLSRH